MLTKGAMYSNNSWIILLAPTSLTIQKERLSLCINDVLQFEGENLFPIQKTAETI